MLFLSLRVDWKIHHAAGPCRDNGAFLEHRRLRLLLTHSENTPCAVEQQQSDTRDASSLPAFSGFRTAGSCADLDSPPTGSSYFLTLGPCGDRGALRRYKNYRLRLDDWKTSTHFLQSLSRCTMIMWILDPGLCLGGHIRSKPISPQRGKHINNCPPQY